MTLRRTAGSIALGMLLLGVSPASAQTSLPAPAPPPPDHGGHGQDTQERDSEKQKDAHAHVHTPEAAQERPPFIPPITDEDRKAAFPDVEGHTVHDRTINSFVLFDQLEWQSGADSHGLNVDTKGWIGGDRDRLWLRADADIEEGRVGEAEVQALYGRHVARWWDLVGGIRQDFRPGSPQTWVAFGIQGLAPYWFEIEATGYVGASGRTHARIEVEYELLFTNRLTLQPLIELDIFGKRDRERGIGAGLSTADLGFRMRYEVRREFAPYVGVTWGRKFAGTADSARQAGQEVSGARFVTGLRLWF